MSNGWGGDDQGPTDPYGEGVGWGPPPPAGAPRDPAPGPTSGPQPSPIPGWPAAPTPPDLSRWSAPATPGHPGGASTQPSSSGTPPAAIAAGIVLVIAAIAVVAAAVFLGGPDDDRASTSTTPSTTKPGPGGGRSSTFDPGFTDSAERFGEGDATLFGPLLPTADEVVDVMGPAQDLTLRREAVEAAGPVTNLCTDIAANALASHVQWWLDDDPETGWELQVGVFDYGSPQEAERVVTARGTDAYLDCLGGSPTNSIKFDDVEGEVLDHASTPQDGPVGATQAVLLRGYWMAGCGKEDGRIALVWRQVGQYTVSTKAFGCEDIDLATTDAILDGLARRLG